MRRTWRSLLSPTWADILLTGAVAAGFASTAHWWGVLSNDAISTAVPGWNLAHHATLLLDPHTAAKVPWHVQVHGHLVSNRMAGVVLIGVPLQVLLAPLGLGPLAPSTVTAVVIAALAVVFVSRIIEQLTSSRPLGISLALALGFGTGIWTNASAELWTHGPDVLWLSLAMLALHRKRHWWAGMAFAPATWTRPHLLLVAVTVAGFLALSRRAVRPAAALLLPAAAALAGLLAWNHWLFGQWSLAGGYDAVGNYSGRAALTGARPSSVLHDFLVSMGGSLVSPLHGLLVYSPFVLVGAVALWFARGRCPDWAWAAALGGLVYQAAQGRLNGFTGGSGQYGYRLTLEWVWLTAPAAAIGYVRLRALAPRVVPLTRTLVATAVATHLIGAFWYQAWTPAVVGADPWRVYAPLATLEARGPLVWIVAALATLLVLAICLVPAAHWAQLGRTLLPSLASRLSTATGVAEGELTSAVPSGRRSRPTRGLPEVA